MTNTHFGYFAQICKSIRCKARSRQAPQNHAARWPRQRAVYIYTATAIRAAFWPAGAKLLPGELIALARAGRGAVHRELARLCDVGLVVTKAVGNQKHFQANQGAPIFNELQAIVLKTVGLAEPIKAALARSPESIDLALVYGSFAKHSDTASSDVDLLIGVPTASDRQ